MKNNILTTGGTGWIGQNINSELIRRNFHVKDITPLVKSNSEFSLKLQNFRNYALFHIFRVHRFSAWFYGATRARAVQHGRTSPGAGPGAGGGQRRTGERGGAAGARLAFFFFLVINTKNDTVRIRILQ